MSTSNKSKLRETPYRTNYHPLVKANRGTRLIAVPNGKKVRNWTIRSQASFGKKVQRLNGFGCEDSPGLSERLRYSPLPATFDCVNTLKGGV